MSADNSTHPSGQVKPRRKLPPLRHHIVNFADIDAGTSTTYRALCGYTFPVSVGIRQDTAPAEEIATWEHCKACNEMERHQADLKRSQAREEKALRLAQYLLDRMDERGLDF